MPRRTAADSDDCGESDDEVDKRYAGVGCRANMVVKTVRLARDMESERLLPTGGWDWKNFKVMDMSFGMSSWNLTVLVLFESKFKQCA